MDMFNEQQDAANSPGGVAPSGDQHTDSPENSGGGESTPIQFLLGSEESAMNASQSVGPTGPSATDLQPNNPGVNPNNQNTTQGSPSSYSAGGRGGAIRNLARQVAEFTLGPRYFLFWA